MYGMAQTGVPFGATAMARDILHIEHRDIETPSGAHPKRPIERPLHGTSGSIRYSVLVDAGRPLWFH